MKTKEQIERKLEDLKKTRAKGDTEVTYLEIALTHDAGYVQHLFNKYSFEVEEDLEILNALTWVLGEDVKFGKHRNSQ